MLPPHGNDFRLIFLEKFRIKVARMDFTVSRSLYNFVEGQVRAARFKNVSDAMSEAIQLLRQRDDLPVLSRVIFRDGR